MHCRTDSDPLRVCPFEAHTNIHKRFPLFFFFLPFAKSQSNNGRTEKSPGLKGMRVIPCAPHGSRERYLFQPRDT